jgi:tetratricopeptide (TPR) repeat protein
MTPRFTSWFAFLTSIAVAGPLRAVSESEAQTTAEQTAVDVEKRLPEVLNAKPASRPTPEQRLAAGEVLLRQRSYERAGEVFGQVVELFRQGKTSTSVHADALFLLAESYFRSDELLASRRHYMELIGFAEQKPYDTYAGRSLSRLVDVALRTHRKKELDFVLAEVERVFAKSDTTSLRYAKAKALFALDRTDEAERLLVTIPKKSVMFPQSQYILGVIYMKRALGGDAPTRKEMEVVPAAAARFARAVLQFQKVTQLEVTTEDHKHVVDLAWMALGRMFYEVDDLLDSADAHSHVRRTSPEFADMLFELSWVYVRLADFERAERGLEVLGVVNPDKLDFAEGALLRADLMLRSKQYDEALSAYRGVHRRFEPIEVEVDAFVASNPDPGRYYDRLIEDRLGVRTRGALPPVVMDWLREESEEHRVFALIDDMTTTSEVLERSRRIVYKLQAVLASPVRVRGFPDVATKLQGVVGLVNQIAMARRDLALALEESNASALSGEMGRVRAERRAEMERMRWFPTATRDFSQRESSGLRRWNGVSQSLQRLQLEVDKLQATANGLQRLLRERDRFGVTLDRGTQSRVETELAQTEREIDDYLSQMERHRENIEAARLQVGFGDARYQNDDLSRGRFTRAFEREMELALAGQAGADAADFAREVKPLLDRLARLDRQLAGLRAGFQAEVAEGVASIEIQVQEEQGRLEAHTRELEALDAEARGLVGEATKHGFERVRARLRDIVLRADVGITHQGWEVRERHSQSVQRLQRERALEQRSLEEEQNEVMFQGEPKP